MKTGAGFLIAMVSLGGCGRTEGVPIGETHSEAATFTTLNTFMTSYLQIDQQTVGSLIPNDANLFSGADPADGTPSYSVPLAPSGTPTFIDWDDLKSDLANHQVMDAYSGKDPTSFPQANECVGPSQVLSKMDLTYIASANNNEYAYIAVQRSNNNGDAGYYWLFTKKAPHLDAGAAPCSSTQQRLTYDLSGADASGAGDVLLAGHFHPNGTPLLRVFRANGAQNGVTAVNAIDYTNTALWTEQPSDLAAVAINETITAPGGFGDVGVVATSGANLGTEVFAEAAVKLAIFTGNGSACGATFYGTVITRSSGSGGTSPDLKDLAGPAVFNFGKTTATPSLKAGCDGTVQFSATATGADGQPIANPTCSWVFDNNPALTASTCAGSIALGAGSHTGKVTVVDPTSTCADTESSASVTAYSSLSLAPSMVGDCAGGLSYAATASGGSGNYVYSWTFHPTGGTTAAASGKLSGLVQGQYNGLVTLTDTHPDGVVCTVQGMAATTVYTPLHVDLQAGGAAQSCPGMTSDAATFAVAVTGGSGNYSYAWSGCSSTTNSCSIDPGAINYCASQAVSVLVTDALAICGSKPSQTQTYSKVTIIGLTSNPPLP
jgi:hypothetical protein